MSSSKKGRPKGALYIVTYKRLEDYIHAFANGHLNLMILVGEAGIAKTRTIRGVLGDSCWIEGQATPFGMYEKLYRHRDELVVIDDVDSLYADRSGIRLLKCLCQTEEDKKVAWHSDADAKSLERRRIPREFTTKSRVIIICNDWRTLNRNVAALQDRGHVLVFEPAASEVHKKAGEWFTDPEIYTWFGENLHRMSKPSFRHYVRARELKSAGMDWKDVLAAHPENKRSRMVAEIMGNTSYQTMKERAEAFIQMGGGCRATFFNHKRRLGSRPPEKPTEVDERA
jgi:hypothetical protein